MFHELFPFYLAAGMTASDYWDGDPQLTVDYRKAEELRRKRQNELAWVQGRYIYDALCLASPLYQPFAKKGTTAHPYLAEPYPTTQEDLEAQKKRQEERKIRENIEKMQVMATAINATLSEKGMIKNG